MSATRFNTDLSPNDRGPGCPKCGKSRQASRVNLSQLMLPEHANPHGNVHGGIVLRMIDEAGAIAAMRHAQRICVTVAIDSMTFHSPVHVGELVSCSAEVSWVGRSSMEVEICVHAENLLSGNLTHTNSAYVVYVALDEHDRPAPVPELILESEADRERWARAVARQDERLAARDRNQSVPSAAKKT